MNQNQKNNIYLYSLRPLQLGKNVDCPNNNSGPDRKYEIKYLLLYFHYLRSVVLEELFVIFGG